MLGLCRPGRKYRERLARNMNTKRSLDSVQGASFHENKIVLRMCVKRLAYTTLDGNTDSV